MPLLTDNKCDCDWPVLWETGNPAFLGRLVYLRVCCMMKAMEEYFETDFHQTFDGEPLYAWNEETTGRKEPDYLTSRIAKKKLAGFIMDAPAEPSAVDENGNRVRSVEGLGDHIEHEIRSVEPTPTGRKPYWGKE